MLRALYLTQSVKSLLSFLFLSRRTAKSPLLVAATYYLEYIDFEQPDVAILCLSKVVYVCRYVHKQLSLKS